LNLDHHAEFVEPICLPFADDSDQVNDPVVLTGWGNFSSVGKKLVDWRNVERKLKFPPF
jgi:hypothetical protein